MLAKKTSKNQGTLPKKIVDGLPETDYFDVTLPDGAVVLCPVAITEAGSKLGTVRKKIRKMRIDFQRYSQCESLGTFTPLTLVIRAVPRYLMS